MLRNFAKPCQARIAVVIPCYKVERHIADVIRGLPSFVRHIVCVNDASPDASAARISEVDDRRVTLVTHSTNQGIGGAMASGYRKAIELGADIVVKMDGDDQMDPAYLAELVRPLVLGEADYAKGNRWENGEMLASMPALRRTGNLALSFLTKVVSGNWRLFDPNNGYHAVRTSVLRKLNLDKLAKDYYFEINMLVELSILRAVVQDVAIPARYGDEVSSLRIGRILRRFPPLLARSLARRIWQQYFIRDFVPASLFLLLGGLLASAGVLYGASAWWLSYQRGVETPAGSVMLAVVPLLMGYQLLLQALVLDIGHQPTTALCSKTPLELNMGSDEVIERAILRAA